MFAVLHFVNRSQARRCVAFCRASGVPVSQPFGGRLSIGYYQVRVPEESRDLVCGAFHDVYSYCVSYA